MTHHLPHPRLAETRRGARRSTHTPIAVALLCALIASPALAQAKVAKEVIEEAVELIFKRAGKQELEQLAEAGGRQLVRETLEKSAEEGGEALVKQSTKYGLEHGPLALRAIGRSPKQIVAALDNLQPALRGPALRAIEREPQLLTRLISQHGAQALEAAAKHPGVGAQLGEKLGGEGLSAAKNLTTDQAIVVARHADEIAALPAAERSAFYGKLNKAPGAVVDFLEKHPKTLLTAAGVTAFIAAKDDILGPPSGDPANPAAKRGGGLVYNVWQDTLGVVRKPLGMVTTVLVALVAGWAAIQLWGAWKRKHVANQLAEAKMRAKG
jgi:hypothetical protein